MTASTLPDTWRVDIAGYSVNVRGEHARDHLQRVNGQLARMKMALHRIKSAGAPADIERIAREGLADV